MSMDRNGGGVKVTYIETQFVTSDAAGFKDLVQRLTGRATVVAPAPAAPHRLGLRPCRASASATSAGPQGCSSYATPSSSVAPPCCQLLEELDCDVADFSDLFYVVGGCNDFPY